MVTKAEPYLGGGSGVDASGVKTIAWDMKKKDCPLRAGLPDDQPGMVGLFPGQLPARSICRSYATHKRWPAAGALSRVGAGVRPQDMPWRY